MHDSRILPDGGTRQPSAIAVTSKAFAPDYEALRQTLTDRPRKWLVTGAAGFIGSNLVEALLKLGQHVVGLDNFATGQRRNLDEVKSLVQEDAWARFRFREGDVCRPEDCQAACAGVDYVLHQAGLGSVPRSLQDPVRSHVNNVNGFLNMAVAARDAKVRRFVYASSSSVYGDHPALPKVEPNIGKPLSPYAATKFMMEVYAGVFAHSYGLTSIGLRYFNVFGPRQDPENAYAAVIPRWFTALLQGTDVSIFGDGETSRDFCYIANVVQANLRAAVAEVNPAAHVFNIAYGQRTTLNQLFARMRELVAQDRPSALEAKPVHQGERRGDIRHSLADVSAARTLLGYVPQYSVFEGLTETYPWYARRSSAVTSKR